MFRRRVRIAPREKERSGGHANEPAYEASAVARAVRLMLSLVFVASRDLVEWEGDQEGLRRERGVVEEGASVTELTERWCFRL